MSKSLEASSPDSGASRVGDLGLSSLAPSFDESRHGGYYKLLVRAMKDKRHRNIALTGAYGAGKSSILQQLVRKNRRKAIVLSLSTITPDAHNIGETTGDGLETSPRTQEIQKEIVKQLLYRLKPSSVPQSRFRRPDLPRQISAAVIAVGVAVVIAALTILLVFNPIQERVERWFPEPWRQQLAYGVAFVLLCFLMWALVKLVRARPRLTASVQSGGATVTLDKGEDSYFDAYLDEIVYFFQASRASIVIIEDIDRFEDVLVFDTLRALNSILNGSRQVGRRVVFIYAIRDSVFEQIGTGAQRTNSSTCDDGAPREEEASTDHALDGLKRASRTKFFDIIIPVVPFVSADNARDLMSDVMASDEFTISPALIRLAARHVADMRLIHNIRNEFEVFRQQLVTSDGRVPGITDDIVFALVLYKNTHLADFENIRHRESRLDYLFMFWRHLVSEELGTRTKSVAQIRRQQRLDATAAARAQRLGTSLNQFRDTLQNASSSTVDLAGPATDDTLMDPSTWDSISAGENQRITLSNGYREVTLSLSASELGRFIGIPVENADWAASDSTTRQKTLDSEIERVKFLRHHSWEELANRDDLNADLNDLTKPLPRGVTANKSLTFANAIELLLDSDLARELIRHGYITSHFAVYSASYYGTHLGPAAREYIWRCIEPGTPDPLFEIDPTQVEQLLREQGADTKAKGDDADIFDDASVFNINILDYLLKERAAAATKVARRLATMGDQERDFLDLYLAHGASPDNLIANLAPYWREVLIYIANADIADPGARLTMLNAALKAIPDSKYETDEQLKVLFEENYQELSALTHPESTTAAITVAAVLHACACHIASLGDLNDEALKAVVELSLYPITFENLQAISPETKIGLDTIESNTAAYKYVLRNLDHYLALVSEGGVSVLVDPERFVSVIGAVLEHSSKELLRRLIAMTSGTCTVPRLNVVEPAAWPALVALGRTTATFANVDDYLAEHGMDATLGDMLRQARSIKTPADASLERRNEVAVEIVNAHEEIESSYLRAHLAKSVRPGMLDPDDLMSEQGKLISYLLQVKLLEDDATAFADRLMVDWDTLKPTILASKNFPSFVTPTLVSITDFTRIVRDSTFSQSLVQAMLKNLIGFLEGASPVQARNLALALVDKGWRLPVALIEAFLHARVGANTILKLLHRAAEKCSVDEVKYLLRLLGGEYAQVAAGGRGRPSFSNSPAHDYVFRRLVGDTVRSVKLAELKRWGGDALIVILK